MQWLNELFDWLVSWLPHLDLMKTTDRGVRFLPGGKTKLIEPGLYVWWPVTTEIEEIAIKRRAESITLRLTTKDYCILLIELTVVFRVNDPMQAIVEVHDFDDTILEMAQKAAVPAVMGRTFRQALDAVVDGTLAKEITPSCKANLRKFGVLVEETFVSDFSETTVICHEGSGLAIGDEDDDEED